MMQNLPFVIWVLGWPLVWDLGGYLDAMSGRPVAPVSASAESVHALLWFCVWVWIGCATYRGRA